MSKADELKEVLADIRRILASAKLEDRIVSKTKLSAEIQMKYGRTKRRTLEYIQTLEDAGIVKSDGDVMWLISQSET